MMERNYIVCDLGATKCLASLVSVTDGRYSIINSVTVRIREYQSLAQMADHIHTSLGVRPQDVDAICVGGAGVYDGEELVLTSAYPYRMLFAQVARAQEWSRYAIVHDYTPIICSTYVGQQELLNVKTISGGQPNPHGHKVVFGVGTGLGVKHGVQMPSGELSLGTNEMGHIGLCLPPKMNRVEATIHREFVRFLQEHEELHSTIITFEKVLSGHGLSCMHQFVKGSKLRLTPEETAADIMNMEDQATLKLFAWYLGLFIGTLQLTFMPSAGIWMYGGVIHKNLILFEEPYLYNLERGIKSCGAYWERRQHFPLHVLIGQEHAFLGGAYYAQQHLHAATTTVACN